MLLRIGANDSMSSGVQPDICNRLTMSSKATQARLRALAERHSEALSALIASGDKRSVDLFAHLAPRAAEAAVWEQLRDGMADLVQAVRSDAHVLSTAHFRAELVAVIGAGNAAKITLESGANPNPSDVAQYIDNAIDATRAMVSGASDDDRREVFTRNAFRAQTIIESEATVAYKVARDSLNGSLLAVSDDDAEKLGFQAAGSQAQLNALAMQPIELRDDQRYIAILGEAWNARAAACDRCRSADGEVRPIGFSFSQPGPTVHARCQCVRTLWAVLVPWPNEERNAMPHDSNRILGDRDTGVAWLNVEIDTRALKIDTSKRIIFDCVASDESIDGHGSKIVAKGWKLDRFGANPILMWNHAWARYSVPAKPKDMLGNAPARVKAKTLLADLRFDTKEINEQAEMVYQQMLAGTIRQLSVGFRPLKYHYEAQGEGQRDLLVIDEAELLEISVVPLGANENAGTGLFSLRDLCPPDPVVPILDTLHDAPAVDVPPVDVTPVECKAAVPYKAFPLKTATKWDGSVAESRVRAHCTNGDKFDWATYRSCFAWYDAAKPEAFGSYKLLHTDVVGGKLTTIDQGVFAAAVVVQGGRGGVKIPDGDMAGVKSHLGKHYKDFGKTAPWDAKKEADASDTQPGTAPDTSVVRGAAQNLQLSDSHAASAETDVCPDHGAQERSLMDKTILEVYGLKADAPETEVLAAATRQRDQLAAFLALSGADNYDAAIGALRALQSTAAKVPELESQLKALADEGTKRDREALIKDNERKFTPHELGPEGWVKDASIDQLRSFIKSAPDRIAAAPTAQPPVTAPKELTPEQRKVCKSAGLTEDQFRNMLNEQEGGA